MDKNKQPKGTEPNYIAKTSKELEELREAYRVLTENYKIKISIGVLNIQKYDVGENNFYIFPKEKGSKIEEIVRVIKNLDASIIKNVIGEYCIIEITPYKYSIKYYNPNFEEEG